MSTNSPVTDFLIRLKNGYLANNKTVAVPASGIKKALAEILKKHQLIDDYSVSEKNGHAEIELNLSYLHHQPKITNVNLFSTPGRRIYSHANSLPWGKSTKSLIIISTSKGLMSQREAVRAHLGGEIIAEVY